jgi:hypothetical protein
MHPKKLDLWNPFWRQNTSAGSNFFSNFLLGILLLGYIQIFGSSLKLSIFLICNMKYFKKNVHFSEELFFKIFDTKTHIREKHEKI